MKKQQQRKHHMLLWASLALATACGGSSSGKQVKTAGQGGAAPAAGGGASAAPAHAVSKGAKEDYQEAMAYFLQQDKGGRWSESACKSSADNFASVAEDHRTLVEAQFMVGLSYHRCNMAKEAERGYQAALRVNANHAHSLSNLGELYFAAGRVDAARRNWEAAVKAYPKLVAARNNLASVMLETLRTTKDQSAWAKLEEDIRLHLSNALAVDSNNVRAYTLYGLVYMEGFQRNKNRLDLAKLLIDEGEKRNAKYAPLKNARGLYFMRRSNLSEALKSFLAAVELDPAFIEARMNVGLTTLGFRNYNTAKEQFSKVLELAPKHYDATIGLGIALRGLGDLDGAEEAYKKAKALDASRGEAVYNLGVLYKDFRASKMEDLRASQAAYRQARDYFRDFQSKKGDDSDKAEARENIALCDKIIGQLDGFIKAQGASK